MNYTICRYYDIQCSDCGRFRSTDYMAGMENNLNRLKLKAEKEGWTHDRKHGNLCPVCSHNMQLQEFIRRYTSV